jgi:hypothetical protein
MATSPVAGPCIESQGSVDFRSRAHRRRFTMRKNRSAIERRAGKVARSMTSKLARHALSSVCAFGNAFGNISFIVKP